MMWITNVYINDRVHRWNKWKCTCTEYKKNKNGIRNQEQYHAGQIFTILSLSLFLHRPRFPLAKHPSKTGSSHQLTTILEPVFQPAGTLNQRTKSQKNGLDRTRTEHVYERYHVPSPCVAVPTDFFHHHFVWFECQIQLTAPAKKKNILDGNDGICRPKNQMVY